MSRNGIRLAIPSKGRLAQEALQFLAECGLEVYRPNDRQYIASIPSQPQVQVIMQRPGDIAIGVRQGSLDFGITGYDVVKEKNFEHEDRYIVLHDALGFGRCTLNLAAPDGSEVRTVADLRRMAANNGAPLRVATKYPRLTADFLDRQRIGDYRLIDAEGTLEIAPMIGFADVIVDLVSSGMTLRENGLHIVSDGEILRSQAVLIANKQRLQHNPKVQALARTMLEYVEAHLRAEASLMVIANMRGETAEAVFTKMVGEPTLAGLRGPTIAPVFTRDDGQRWFSISVVVARHNLNETITALRRVGGSGVIVTPAIYIFEEEPIRYRAMLDQLNLAHLEHTP